MSVYPDAQAFYKCVGGLLERVRATPLAETLENANFVLRFRCVEPHAVVTVDTRPNVNAIRYGDDDIPADIELTMHADVAHRFWLGQANPVAEVMAGRIVCRGPLSKLASALPLLRSARQLYPEHLRATGYAHLLED
jgi:hypothetical protein